MKKLPLLLMILVLPSRAQAQVVISDAHADIYSALEYARDVVQTIQQVQHLLHDKEVAKIEALKYLALYEELVPFLEEVSERLNVGESLTYDMEDLAQRYDRLYQGFKPTGHFLEDFDQWTKTTLDTLKGTLHAGALQKEKMKDEQVFLKDLERYNKTAKGRDQLIQTGNMLQTYLTKETTKIRELLLSQLNAENVYRANELNMKAEKLAKTNEWLTGNAVSYTHLTLPTKRKV